MIILYSFIELLGFIMFFTGTIVMVCTYLLWQEKNLRKIKGYNLPLNLLIATLLILVGSALFYIEAIKALATQQ